MSINHLDHPETPAPANGAFAHHEDDGIQAHAFDPEQTLELNEIERPFPIGVVALGEGLYKSVYSQASIELRQGRHATDTVWGREPAAMFPIVKPRH